MRPRCRGKTGGSSDPSPGGDEHPRASRSVLRLGPRPLLGTSHSPDPPDRVLLRRPVRGPWANPVCRASATADANHVGPEHQAGATPRATWGAPCSAQTPGLPRGTLSQGRFHPTISLSADALGPGPSDQQHRTLLLDGRKYQQNSGRLCCGRTGVAGLPVCTPTLQEAGEVPQPRTHRLALLCD